MVEQRSWAVENAAGIGKRVAFYRDRTKMSAQQLADRCAGLGMPAISRVVITKLENGRRETVSTAELQVLAEALGVAPALLLFPLGHAATVEVLPGREMDTWDACRWLLGGVRMFSSKGIDPDSPIALWADHENLAAVLANNLKGAESSREAIGAEGYDRMLAGNVNALRRLREQMRGIGMTPPPLDPETAREVGEEADDGSR